MLLTSQPHPLFLASQRHRLVLASQPTPLNQESVCLLHPFPTKPHTDTGPPTVSAPLTQVWRMRAYKTEQTLGAAKPLWFVKMPLQIPKDSVQRFV